MSNDTVMFGKVGVDPITNCPEPARELLYRFGRIADGHNADDVINAALNIVINQLRQIYPAKKDAGEAVDRLVAKTRQALDNHYFPNGMRRSIFPFHQVIEVPFLGDLKDQKAYGVKR
jgi:hypothetical protein